MAMLENIVKGKIANALTSAAKDHVVATTDDIYDINMGMYQDEINALIGSAVGKIDEIEGNLETISGEVSTIKSELQDIHSAIEQIQSELQETRDAIRQIQGDVQGLKDDVRVLNDTKQDVIPDLSTIRSGARAGSTAVQPSALNNYYTKQQTNNLISTKQDKLVAGDNIIIEGTTISAEYTEPEVTVPEVLDVLNEDDE